MREKLIMKDLQLLLQRILIANRLAKAKTRFLSKLEKRGKWEAREL